MKIWAIHVARGKFWRRIPAEPLKTSEKSRKLPIENFKCCWKNDTTEGLTVQKLQRREPEFELNPILTQNVPVEEVRFWQDTFAVKLRVVKNLKTIRTTEKKTRAKRRGACVETDQILRQKPFQVESFFWELLDFSCIFLVSLRSGREG